MSSAAVSNVSFDRAPHAQIREGLLGFILFSDSAGCRIHCVLRRTNAGRFEIRYPERKTGAGRRVKLYWPESPALRQEQQRQIFAALVDLGVLPWRD